MKFGRHYRLTIQMNDKEEAIVIEPPFTIQFNIERNTYATLNTMTLLIYNLGKETRGRILHDAFDTANLRTVILEVGYDELATVFIGNIQQAGSQRQGANIITSINAWDGGFDTVNSTTFTTLSAGATIGDVLRTLAGHFPNINQGVLSGPEATFSRPVIFDGNTFEQLKKYSNFKTFIDLNTVHVLQDNEVLVAPNIDVIDPSTGLLETPRRDEAFLSITTLLEPRIIMGQAISLESTVAQAYNGQYKVIGVSHEGVISEAIGGQCISRFNLLMGNQLYGKYLEVSATRN